MTYRIVIAVIMILAVSAVIRAQDLRAIDLRNMHLCPVADGADHLAATDSCQTITGFEIDPQHSHFVIHSRFEISQGQLTSTTPLGLYIAGKMASRAYVNGQLVGENGKPAPDAEREVPGKMDAVFFLPTRVLEVGTNSLALEMSGHHSLITLKQPIHLLAVGPYGPPNAWMLDRNIPALVPLVFLIVGGGFFAFLALKTERWRILLPLSALFGAAQLLGEVSRGLIPYDYPFHDVRLVMVAGFAGLMSACFFLYVVRRLLGTFAPTYSTIILVVTAGVAILIDGFDRKAFFGVLIPALATCLTCLIALRRGEESAKGYLGVMIAFCLTLILAPYTVLDVGLFYALAVLVMALFAQQLREFLAQRRALKNEQQRADQLEGALERAQEQARPSQIQVTRSGLTEHIATDRILYCKGAADYIEMMLEDGTTRLHAGPLTKLEEELPGIFLRVHRSYLVNTSHVVNLRREKSGAGHLALSGDHSVPVSRRIMPKVKQALAHT